MTRRLRRHEILLPLCYNDGSEIVIEHLPATEASGGEEGYVLEFFNAIGESIAVVAVPASAIEPLRADEILSARPLVPAK